MGDGRFEATDLLKAVHTLARRAILFDMERLAQAHGSVINAVMLGVIAGSGATPIPVEAYEKAIETSGVAVAGNLRGFKGRTRVRPRRHHPGGRPGPDRKRRSSGRPGSRCWPRRPATFPPIPTRCCGRAYARAVDFQSLAYGRRYLDRAARILAVDKANGGAERGFALTVEGGRYLALWMSYEDIIRVADLKSRPERMARVRREVGAKADEPLVVTEFLKPGFEEVASVLPPFLGRALTRFADAKPSRRKFHVAMRVKTNTVFGYARLRALAKMRFWRPRTYPLRRGSGRRSRRGSPPSRARPGTATISRSRSPSCPTCARAIPTPTGAASPTTASCSRGSPCRRPRRAGDAAAAAAALNAARTAALADPEGEALDAALAAAGQPRPAAETAAAE